MEKRGKNWIRRGTAILLTVLLAAAIVPSVLAAEKEPCVLRVPFPEVAGLTETAEDGSRHGLVVDYLNEIAKYTDWEYEYIDTDGDHMIGEFMEGKYDLMGAPTIPPALRSIMPIRITISATANRYSWPVWTTTASTATICAV